MLIKTPKEKKPVTHFTAAQEAVLDAKIEKHFQSQRELPNGRHFLWNSYRFKSEYDNNAYRRNFDNIFPNAPGRGI
ncbi:MAG: hypothetical protein M0R00_01375 [Candidatus Omnitrophica bacterium]|jgi:hypothetical protein|nr:hypothetical protein [Candidatus Omnitrophota bacterium]